MASKYLKTVLFLLFCSIALFNEIFMPCNMITTREVYRSVSTSLNCHFDKEAVFDDVEIVGINQLNGSRIFSKARYILLLPRSSQCSTCRRKAWKQMNHLISLLSSLNDIDGASCYGGTQRRYKSCRFYTKHWSMVINNGSNLQTSTIDNQTYTFYNCNIVEGQPLLIRREIFNKLGLRPSHGETTLLEFFLRSKGNLKIANSLNCSFNNKQLISNRGAMGSKEIYLDYGLLGYNHNLLRIINVHQESIIWTQCTRSANASVCPNKPLQDIDTSISRKLANYCCNVALDKYLIDAVTGLKKTGIDYRLSYGTTLGAMREKNIIPWTADIDIDVPFTDYLGSHSLSKLQQVMHNMHYSTPIMESLRRIIPMFPLVTHVQNLSHYNLFSDVVLGKLRDALPIDKPSWKSLGYVDIYPFEKDSTFGAPSYITINGRLYKTYSDPQSYLAKAFGESWKEPNHSFNSASSYIPILSSKNLSICWIMILLVIVYCFCIAIFVAAKYAVFRQLWIRLSANLYNLGT